jgi:hypothetical protein
LDCLEGELDELGLLLARQAASCESSDLLSHS